MKPPKTSLTHAVVVQLGELIKAHCTRQPDGTARYSDGWNDERIVEAMQGRINIGHASRLRRALIGDFVKQPKRNTLPDLIARVEALERWATQPGANLLPFPLPISPDDKDK
jgi:hypothetical protein